MVVMEVYLLVSRVDFLQLWTVLYTDGALLHVGSFESADCGKTIVSVYHERVVCVVHSIAEVALSPDLRLKSAVFYFWLIPSLKFAAKLF